MMINTIRRGKRPDATSNGDREVTQKDSEPLEQAMDWLTIDGICGHLDRHAFLEKEVQRLSDDNTRLRQRLLTMIQHMAVLAEAVDKLTTWYGLATHGERQDSISHKFGPTIAKARVALEELGGWL